jgi:hypothetical protein
MVRSANLTQECTELMTGLGVTVYRMKVLGVLRRRTILHAAIDNKITKAPEINRTSVPGNDLLLLIKGLLPYSPCNEKAAQ